VLCIISIIGILLNLEVLFYSGLAASGASFAFINRFLPYSELALIRILAAYLIFYTAWRLSVIAELFDDVDSPDNIGHILISHHTKLIVNVSLACILSFIGTLMAFQGYQGVVISPIAVFLVFTMIFFVLLMFLIRYLPEYFFKSPPTDTD